MNIEHFLTLANQNWMQSESDSDIVISTRIRLARNIANVRFPISFTEQDAEQIDQQLMNALLTVDNENPYRFSYFSIKLDIYFVPKLILTLGSSIIFSSILTLIFFATSSAVDCINCISPHAPLVDLASSSKLLSAFIIAYISSLSTLYCFAYASTYSLYLIGYNLSNKKVLISLKLKATVTNIIIIIKNNNSNLIK